MRIQNPYRSIEKIAQDYDLPLSGRFGEKRLSIYTTPLDEKLDEALKLLGDLDPGLWLWVCHPGIDSPEQRALVHTAPEDIFVRDGVGRHRARVLEVLQSLDLRSQILSKQIRLTNYREVWAEKKKK